MAKKGKIIAGSCVALAAVVAGEGDGTDKILFQRDDYYAGMMEIFDCMLHQQGNPVFFAHKVKNIIHVCACVDNPWFKTLLPADFRDLIIMQSGFAQKKQIFVSQFGDGDLLLFTQ